MADGGLVNFGDLGKPATVLVEKISDAIGGIAKPWQIRRIAKAEADAAVISQEAKIKISEIERRALQRMVREEGLRQKNIEDITIAALPHLNEDAQSEELTADWISTFFDRGRLGSGPVKLLA